MSVWPSSADPSNMGQESSAPAQQSVNTSAAGGHRVGSIQGNHNPDYANDATDRRRDEPPSDRNYQQAHGAAIKFPLPRMQQTYTPDARVQPRSSPLLANHGSARFPSPGSARHRFVRENLDGRQTTDDRSTAHPTSSRSPISRFRSRDDLTNQQSPVSGRYSDNNASWAQNSGLPDTREPAGHRPGDATLDRTRDYHGLRNVPVGPRLSFSGTTSVKKDHSTRSPCIFISLRYIPKLPNLRWHLNKMLKAYRPEEIVIDDFGWNLIYHDSPAGQQKLKQCYENYDKRMFFDEYELVMQCFPNGKLPHPQCYEDANSVNGFDESSDFRSPHRRSSNAAPPNLAGFEGRRVTCPEPIKSPRPASVTGSLHLNDKSTTTTSVSPGLSQSFQRHSPEAQRSHEITPNRFNASLLRLPSDRDETASLASGVTRSDGSRVKRNKCHRCNGESAPGPSTLVRCSTCSRQYHRRCHQDPAIPVNLLESHDWSCARCVKKGRAAKHTQKNDGDASLPQLGLLSVEPGSSLGCLPGKDEQKRFNGHVPPACYNSDLPVTRTPRSDSKSPQGEIERSAAANTDVNASIVNNDPAHSDADDLVARSFATSELKSRLNPRSQTPGKLKITRTKLPPPAPTTVNRHPGRDGPSAQPEILVVASPKMHATTTQVKIAEVSEPVVRNSVADLRALANERHQSAIKSGIQERAASEERERRFIPLKHHDLPSEPPPTQPQRRRDLIPAAPVTLARETEREIPESPEEVRRIDPNSGNVAKDPPILSKQSSLARESAERTPDAESLMDERPPILKGPRPPSHVVRCGICQKKIPPGPSGKNKLCSGCKKDKAAAAVGEDASFTRASPLTNVTPAFPAGAPVARMIAGPTQTVDPKASVNNGAGGSGSQPQKHAAPVASDNTINATAMPVRGPDNTTGSGQQISPQVENSVDRNTDMPTTKLSRSDSQDVISNSLAAQILGELFYVPTMQKQLRDDPDPSEEQLRQLKRILLEDELARTDMQVLAAKMEVAPTGLGSRSRSPNHIPVSRQSASINHTTSTQAVILNIPSSNPRLDFIKSVVGNSSERPKGSRLILVAMALGSVASRRMQAKDVMDWIADTVPGYKKGEGNWMSRISAQLSQGRLTDSGGYWREENWQDGDGGKPKGRWYQLLPERQDEMWTWCPILGEPLSPSRRNKARVQASTGKKALDTSQSGSTPLQASATSESVSIYCGSALLKGHDERIDVRDAEPVEYDAMEIDGITFDDATALVQGQKRKYLSSPKPTGEFTPERMECSSGDDEPLSMQAKRRRRETASLDGTRSRATPQRTFRANIDEQSDSGPDPMIVGPTENQDSTYDTTTIAHNASSTNGGQTKLRSESLYLQDLGKTAREISSQPSLSSPEPLAVSLYNEWSEYRQHASDEYDKLVEISRRPRKKQAFGKVSSLSKSSLHEPFSGSSIVAYNPSPEKRSRTTMPTLAEPYPWENPNIDLTRKEYTSLDEFFDFPDNMIPIISEGQLAYRDGTRTDDGRLPRAREIFRPG